MTSIESAKRYLVTLAPHIKSRKAAVLIGELILDLEDKIVENVTLKETVANLKLVVEQKTEANKQLKQEIFELRQKLDNLNLITSDYRDYK
jgi:hypothetical protein